MAPSQQSLEKRVLRFIREHRLLGGPPVLVVAVSGGPDSVCLFHLLHSLKAELGVSLHIAHLDHQLRGADSEADARYVAELAREFQVPVTLEGHDVRAYRAEHHLSLEEAAREVRYDFLARVARETGAGRVAVGHTADDHVETILMHLIRGTGTRGLRGLSPSTRWQGAGLSVAVVRPLLTVTREETADYCRQHGLKPRLDASNLSLSPLRNRIRLELLPLLARYNPRVVDALVRTARIAADDFALVETEAARCRPEITERSDDTLTFDKPGLLKLPPALRRQLIRTALEDLLGSPKDIEAGHIEEVLATLEKPAGKKVVLPEGLSFATEYDRYLLGREPAALCPLPPLAGEFTLNVPGETIMPGWRIETAIEEKPETMEKPADYTACFDFDRTGDRLTVRPRRRGDRFQPLGMPAEKKIGQFMIDARIPRAWRDRVPILASPDQVVWVVGWHIDERVKVTPDTRRILRIGFERC